MGKSVKTGGVQNKQDSKRSGTNQKDMLKDLGINEVDLSRIDSIELVPKKKVVKLNGK